MEISDVLNIIVPIVLIAVGIALVVFIVELTRMVKSARNTLAETTAKLDPLLANVEEMTTTVKPAVARMDPVVERVQLTLDAVNLEMMRVDEILEDVSHITDAASSATSAVDNITNAPIKAVNNVATRVRSALGTKGASDESAQISGQRDSVDQALKDYLAAEAADAAQAEGAVDAPAGDDAIAAASAAVAEAVAETAKATAKGVAKAAETATETAEAAAEAAVEAAETTKEAAAE